MSLKKLASSLQFEDDSFKNEFDVGYFAKKAADLYMRDKVPLNQSIKKFAETNRFNGEQVRRICESSNHDVNQRLFDSQDDKNIQFDVADSSQILAEPQQSVKVAQVSFYDFTPSEFKQFTVKEASISVEDSNSHDMEWDISGIDPKLTLMNIREKFASANEHLEDKIYVTDFQIKEANYRLFKLAKEELEENPYYKVAQAIALSSNRYEILEDITEQLIDSRLVSDEDMYTVVKSAGELDLNHPIVTTTKKYASLLNDRDMFSAAKEEIEERLKNLDYHLSDR